jgi:transposase-like protein
MNMNKRYSAAEKAELLEELANSGLSVSAFSRQTKITDATLYKWRKELLAPSKITLHEFIQIATAHYYEFQRPAVILRVPATVRVERLSELMNKLSC